MTAPANLHTRDLSRMGKGLAAASNFADLVIHTFDDPELSEHGEEDASSLVHLIPEAVARQRADDLVKLVKRQSGRFMLVGAVVELLSRVGAWPQAVEAMQASWEAVPDTAPERRLKWYRRLHVIAVQFEAAVAAKDIPARRLCKWNGFNWKQPSRRMKNNMQADVVLSQAFYSRIRAVEALRTLGLETLSSQRFSELSVQSWTKLHFGMDGPQPQLPTAPWPTY